MELVVNCSMLGPNATGLGVYGEQCAKAIERSFEAGQISGLAVVVELPAVCHAPKGIALGQGAFAAIRRAIWSRSQCLRSDQLLYSPTHHGLSYAGKQVITIHDLIALKFPRQHLSQYLFFRFLMPRMLKSVDAIFTVSETSKHDIAATYKYPLDRIFVVPNGFDRITGEKANIKVETGGRKILLAVGARYPHKNLEEVIKQYRKWSGRYKLVITSCGNKYGAKLRRIVAELDISNHVELLGYVPVGELKALYEGCHALVYPSRWEGFGIPPLEALASGRPVLVSDIPVHREILGEAGIFVRLGDDASWDDGWAALEDGTKISSCMNAARSVLERFTWHNSAKALQTALLTVEPRLKTRLR